MENICTGILLKFDQPDANGDVFTSGTKINFDNITKNKIQKNKMEILSQEANATLIFDNDMNAKYFTIGSRVRT